MVVKPESSTTELAVSGMDDGSPPKPHRTKEIMAGLSAAIGSFSMGCVLGYTSPAIPDMRNPGNPFTVDKIEESWTGSLMTIGALIGGLIAGSVIDYVGRKKALVLTVVPFLVGWVIIMASQSVYYLYVGRFICGLTVGLMSLNVPVYITEIASPEIRGMLGSCHQLAITMGILYVYVFGSFLHWRWLGLACAVWLLLLAAMMLRMPEAPRWLLSKNRKEDAMNALKWLRGEGDHLIDEANEMEKTLQEEAGQTVSFSDFTEKVTLVPLLISLALMLFQQLSGINVVMFYTTSIFESAGSTLDANVSTIIVGAVGVAGTFLAVLIIDRAGRLPLLFASAAIMIISLAALGAFFLVKENDEQMAKDDLGWLPVISLVLFNIGFAIAFGPIPWLMMGELFPLRVRGVACSIATAFNWLCAFLITKFFVNLTDDNALHQYGGYWLCACICGLSVVFNFFVTPETKGKTIEQIVDAFKQGKYFSVGWR